MITCLIVDDQAMVREGFGAILNAQDDMSVVGQAANGVAAVALYEEHLPDVILMDVRMPIMDGLEATRRILTEHREEKPVRVLILTTFDLDEYVYEALRSGASGFLLKDAPAAELVHAVRVVAAGDALLAPSVTRRLIADFSRQRPSVASASTVEELTPRENEILRLSLRDSRTRRSAKRCSSPSRRPKHTSGGFSTSWDFVTAPRPWCSPTSLD